MIYLLILRYRYFSESGNNVKCIHYLSHHNFNCNFSETFWVPLALWKNTAMVLTGEGPNCYNYLLFLSDHLLHSCEIDLPDSRINILSQLNSTPVTYFLTQQLSVSQVSFPFKSYIFWVNASKRKTRTFYFHKRTVIKRCHIWVNVF